MTNCCDHYHALYNDPPLAELVLILLGAVGLLVIFKAKKTTPYFRTALVAAIITTICLGAWWWTEIIYDLQVVHSQVELRLNPLIPVPAAGPVGATAGNSRGSECITEIASRIGFFNR